MINKNIQIMRAFSLLAVFFFHLEINYFKFGYLGVDVFFIISGFLMPIILPKYTPFSYIKARVKRLYPALSFVVLVSLIIGFYISMPGEYYSLSESSLASLVFGSNYYFFFNTGYFDIESKIQFLLHTWTLGNEFLGYLLIFIVWLIFGKKNLLPAAYLLCASSLVYILFKGSDLQYLDPIPRLYLFFFAFIVASKYKTSPISEIGLYSISLISLILIVILFGNSIVDHQWPNNSIILLPLFVIPILLMKRSISPSILRPALMKIGEWSYSIYLWHWLVISVEFVFLRNSSIVSTNEAIILFIPGFAFGVLSYYFIEKNIKLCFVTTTLSVIIAIYVYSHNGIESRVNEDVVKYSKMSNMVGVDYLGVTKNKGLKFQEFQVNDRNSVSTLVIGDSFSQHVLPIMGETPAFENQNIYRLSAQPDTLVSNWDEIDSSIRELGINNVLISYSLNSKESKDIEKLPPLLNQDHPYKITVIRDIPSTQDDPVSCYIKDHSNLLFKGCGFDIGNGIPTDKVHNKENRNWDYLKKESKAYKLIDSHLKLCDSDTCKVVINDEFIMRDRAHFNEKLSRQTNKQIGELIF